MKHSGISVAALAIAAIGMVSCNELKRADLEGFLHSTSGTPDERFEQSMLYEQSSDRVTEFNAPAEEYNLYLCSDSHLNGDYTYPALFAEKFLSDEQAVGVCLHLGDIIDIKGAERYDEIKMSFGDAWKRMYTTAGNHDLYFAQWDAYLENCGGSSYSFVVKTPGGAKDLYICYESGGGTLGIKQREWLDKTLEDASSEGYRHIIPYSHTNFFKKDYSGGIESSYNVEETYSLVGEFARTGVDMVLTGHSHVVHYTTCNGIPFISLGALKDGCYCVLRVGDGFTDTHLTL